MSGKKLYKTVSEEQNIKIVAGFGLTRVLLPPHLEATPAPRPIIPLSPSSRIPNRKVSWHSMLITVSGLFRVRVFNSAVPK